MENQSNESSSFARFPIELWRLIAVPLSFEDLINLIMTGNRGLAYNVSRSTSTFDLQTLESGFGRPSRYLKRTRLFANVESVSLASKFGSQLFTVPLSLEILPSTLTSLKLYFAYAPHVFVELCPRPNQLWPALETLHLVSELSESKSTRQCTFRTEFLPQTLRHFKLENKRYGINMTLADFLKLPLSLETLYLKAQFGDDEELEQKFGIPWRSLTEFHLHTRYYLVVDWTTLPSTLQVLDVSTYHIPLGSLDHDFRTLTPHLRHFLVTDAIEYPKCTWDFLDRLPESVTQAKFEVDAVVSNQLEEITKRRAPALTRMSCNFWFTDLLVHFTHLESLSMIYTEFKNDFILPPNLKSLVVKAMQSPIILPASLTSLRVFWWSTSPAKYTDANGEVKYGTGLYPAVNFPANLKEIHTDLDAGVLRLLPKTMKKLNSPHKMDAQATAMILDFHELTHLYLKSQHINMAFIEALPKSLTSLEILTPPREGLSRPGATGRGLADHLSLTSLRFDCPSADTLPRLPPQLTSFKGRFAINPIADSNFAAALPRGLKKLSISNGYRLESKDTIEALPQGLEELESAVWIKAIQFLPPQLSLVESSNSNDFPGELYFEEKEHVLQRPFLVKQTSPPSALPELLPPRSVTK